MQSNRYRRRMVRITIRALNDLTCFQTHQLFQPNRHSACECLPLFTGPHCEYIRTSSEIRIAGKSIYGSDDDSVTTKALGGFLAVVATFFVVLLIFGMRQVKRIIKRRNEPSAEVNLQGFREKYEEEEFLGALSPNGNMLFPGFGGGSRLDDQGTLREEDFVLSDVFLH